MPTIAATLGAGLVAVFIMGWAIAEVRLRIDQRRNPDIEWG